MEVEHTSPIEDTWDRAVKSDLITLKEALDTAVNRIAELEDRVDSLSRTVAGLEDIIGRLKR